MTIAQEEDLYGYELCDTAGDKIGTVDNMWNDIDTNKLEFVSVKTGWFAGKIHVVPVANASIDNASNRITISYSKDQVKDAPSVANGEDISPEQEDEIYDYYGLNRSTRASGSGLPTGQETSYQQQADGAGERSLTLSEEELRVGKREVETGRVRLRKVVHTRRVEEPVELRREEVRVERVGASGADLPGDAFQEGEVEVVARHEEPVVGKEAHVTGAVRLDKDVHSETVNVGDDVRYEDVEVEDGANVTSGKGSARR